MMLLILSYVNFSVLATDLFDFQTSKVVFVLGLLK